MTTARDPRTVQRLAEAFEAAQRFAPDDPAIDVARKIATASDPIWNAAMHWLEHATTRRLREPARG
jgi:hypothetical protein